MNVVKISQPEFNDVLGQKFDLVVCASGYESRSSSLANHFAKLKSQRIAFGFSENRDSPIRLRNDEKFKINGFEIIDLSGNSTDKLESFLKSFFHNKRKEHLRILIDISSMTRNWYGSLIRTLWAEKNSLRITTVFTYVSAAFPKEKQTYPPNEIVAPVSGFSSLNIVTKPTALILGLGFDEKRAIGLVQELDPVKTVVFHTSPASDKRYDKLVLRANFDILKMRSENEIFKYPLHDTVATYNILESVCVGLLREYSVVLTSLGPKIFGLCCFLVATKYPEISVWRVSAGTKHNVIDHKPSKQISILEVDWQSHSANDVVVGMQL